MLVLMPLVLLLLSGWGQKGTGTKRPGRTTTSARSGLLHAKAERARKAFPGSGDDDDDAAAAAAVGGAASAIALHRTPPQGLACLLHSGGGLER